MFDIKINEIKEQTKKYIYERNIDVYIKLQSLYEYIIKDYIKTEYDDSETVVFLIDSYVSNQFKKKQEVIENVKKINRYANAGVKHYNEMQVIYDEKLVKETVRLFNLLNEFLNPKNISRFYLDIKIPDLSDISLYKYTEHKKEKEIVKKTDDIIINSGTSKTSNGFTIKKVVQKQCDYEYKNVYAVIFNLMQRSKKIEKDKIVTEYEQNKGLIVDYSIVYKYEMTLLILIKNNYFSNNLLEVCSVDKYINEMECAIFHISKLAQYIFSLMKKDIELITISYSSSGIQIALNSESEISIYDNVESETDRTIWYAPNIKYSINIDKDINILQELLEVLLKYKNFKPGQVEAISKILNENDSEIVIMPTGSGKSLIYYFISLLQPSPTLIVEPTELLVKDQIRNLKELHNIDDCIGYLKFDNYEINLNHNFVYITPRVLQNKDSILSLINANVGLKIANIILDEIHTISNWSHDFRPDYLMLSFNLKTFLDNFRYLGFTATANYRVMKDISNQLNISFDKIYTPIELNNNNIKFYFKNHKDENTYINFFSDIAHKIVDEKEEKMIVFTKNKNTNDQIIKNVDDLVKYDIDVLSDDDENSYEAFVNGRRSILISKTDMGIGVNIPYVNKILHYGIPISKSKYVQEIGRAGRNGTNAISYISFIGVENLSNDDLKLIDLNTSIDEILDIIRDSNSDVSLSFKQLLAHLDDYSSMAMRIKNLYKKVEELNNSNMSHAILQVTYKNEKEKNTYETCLYFLYQMGIIYNWYIVRTGKDYVAYDVEVTEDLTLSIIKKKCIEYILLFGNSKETIYNIEHFESIEEIIYELQTWYYNQFLLYHREQLVNMYEFVENCSNNNYSDERISSILFEYFNLTSTDIEEDAETYINRIKCNQRIAYKEDSVIEEDEETYKKESIIPIDNIKDNKFINIIKSILEDSESEIKYLKFEKYLESNYDVIADIYIFTYNTLKNNQPSITRLERILKELENEETFINYIAVMYKSFNDLKFKLKMINLLKKHYKEDTIYSTIYKYNLKDIVYYNYLSEVINNRLED